MSAQDNGGPAFPRDHAADGHNGMDLRDYFAAKAMQAYISSDAWREDMGWDATARSAYAVADAMLKAREA